MSQATFRSDYYDEDGTRLTLTCADGDCLVEIARPNSLGQMIRVDVMFQPRDAAGRPAGAARIWQSRRVTLDPRPCADFGIGRFWLSPGLPRSALSTCYFRVRAVDESV